MTLSHISLEELQTLPLDTPFFACFSTEAQAHPYVMLPEIRNFVTYRAHNVHGVWTGDRGCEAHPLLCGNFTLEDPNKVCPGCHHLQRNHPECNTFGWLTVLCEGQHVKLG